MIRLMFFSLNKLGLKYRSKQRIFFRSIPKKIYFYSKKNIVCKILYKDTTYINHIGRQLKNQNFRISKSY